MRPALSILLFTTLSGSGLGLLAWLCVALLAGAVSDAAALAMLVAGTFLTAAGLLCSLAHLGQPQRAWRALSQWRSSWLSREGVSALLLFPAAAALALPLLGIAPPLRTPAAIAVLCAAAATLVCTAMIYASLRTIPAWSDRLVLPGFAGFAIVAGGAWFAVMLALAGWRPAGPGWLALLSLPLVLALLKLWYWRRIARLRLPGDAAGALGLGAAAAGRRVAAFEAPHTEQNYISREMGFVFARRHATVMKTATVTLLVAVPAAALLVTATADGRWLPWALVIAAMSIQVAALLERWLFFAQARHVVTHYYPGGR